jgi:hypothetical protein
MTERVRKMKASDACICGSRKEWGKCCGSLLKNKEGLVGRVRFTNEEPVRFFLGNMRTNDAYADEDGNVLVFINRAQAMALNEALNDAFQIVGMGETKWQLFQKDVPNHLVISDAQA